MTDFMNKTTSSNTITNILQMIIAHTVRVLYLLEIWYLVLSTDAPKPTEMRTNGGELALV